MKIYRLFATIVGTTICVTSALGRDARPATKSTHLSDSGILLDKYNQVVQDALQVANKRLNARESRRIAKGAQPSIVLTKDRIRYNGAQLFLGAKLDAWLGALPPEPRCVQFTQSLKSCHWDNLGLTLSVNGATSKIERLDIQFQKPIISAAAEIVAREDRLRGQAPPLTSEPVGTFRGYFELDGYGIDSNTMFWEIESSIDQSRNLHCGLKDCQFRGAIFGNKSRIYIQLDGPAATDTVSLIQIEQE